MTVMNNLELRTVEIANKLKTLCVSNGGYGGGSQNVFVQTTKVRNCQTKMVSFGVDISNEYFEDNSESSTSNCSSILITGDPGLGKTFLAKHLFMKLLEKCEKSIGSGVGCLPIYISLPTVVNAFADDEKQAVNLRRILKTQLELINLVPADIEGRKLILILDGYDECNIPIENFGASPIMETNPQINVIIFSRPDSLSPKLNLRESLFGLENIFENSKYLEFELIPFSFLEVEEYVRQFCEVGHAMIPKDASWDAAEYISWLKTIPDLQEISGTPLLLSLILPAMPKIVKKYSDNGNDHCRIRQICSTQTGIFDEFTQQWFEYQSERNQNTNILSADHFQRFCRIYSQNLATLLVDSHGFLKEGTWTLEETLDLSLLEPVKDSNLMAQWSSFKTIFNENVSIVKAIKDSCLLSYSNSSYHFFHRSIAEYFAAKEISETLVWSYNAHINAEQAINATEVNKSTSVSKINFSSSILEKLGDRVKSSTEFENLLLVIIRKSAEVAGLAYLASGCLSILNAAQYNFSGMDFQDIIVPFANMKQSFCAKTDFRGANLQGVDFTRSYLVNARFEGANLRDANFGEELQVTLPCENSIFAITEKLSCYRTPSGNVNLFLMYSKINENRPGTKMHRNDEIIAHEMNFDTGLTTKSFSLGRSPLSNLNYDIIGDNLQLVTWAHPVSRPSSLHEFDIKVWNLSLGTNIKTVSIRHWFICPNNLIFSEKLVFDKTGKWVATHIGQHILVTRFSLEKPVFQFKYAFPSTIKICYFIFAPKNGLLAIFTYENIHILELGIENSVVVVRNEDKLEHPCYDMYKSVSLFDNMAQFMVYGGDIGPRTLKLFHITTKKLSIFKGHSVLFNSVSFNYDSTLLAAGDIFSNILIWKTENGQLFQMFSRDANKAVNVCFHLEKNLLACSMLDDRVIKFWKVGNYQSNFDAVANINSISRGNINCISSTHDGHFVATLQHISIEKIDETVGESDVCQLSLNIWELDENNSFLLKPKSVKVGALLGTGTAGSFSHNKKFIIVGTLLTEPEDSSTNNPLYYKGLIPEHVALIYDLSANLISKFSVEHDTWKGLKSLNYRSALFFQSHCATDSKINLATALWDGSIQLWTFSDTKFVKRDILESPEEILSLDRKHKFVDPLNTKAFRKLLNETDQFWIHICFLTFSHCGNWVISNVNDSEKIVVIWNLNYLKENVSQRFYVVKVKTNILSRPLALGFNSQVNHLFWISPHDYQVIRFGKHCRVVSTDSKLELVSAKMYGPFNWLICGDRNGTLRIWNALNNEIILEIPFWFPIYALAVYKVDDHAVNIIFGGFYNSLLGLRVSKYLEWKLFRVFQSQKSNLVAQDCIVSQSLQVTEWSKRILKGLGARGQPAHLRQQYYSFHQLFRELPGTASSLPTPSLVHTNDSVLMKEISADNNIWIVSIVAKTPKTKFHKFLRLFGIRHLFIVLEGSINLRKFAIRADLRQEPTTGNVIYVVTSYESSTQFSEDMKNCEGRQWEISPKWGRNLIKNIRRDQQLVWSYDFLLHNCISWCHAHLIRVGVPSTYQQLLFHNSILMSSFNIKLFCFIFVTLLAVVLSFSF